MAHYLVTGGAGFIGSHLVDALLRDGHRVRVLDDLSTGRRMNLHAGLDGGAELIVGDVADGAAVRSATQGVDGVFHLAAVASVARANEDWAGTHRVNLGGTIAVLDAARANGGLPVVYASSAAVYGDLASPATEQAPVAPLSAYGADKLGSELHARAGFHVHGVPSVGFRFFNVYGPRQDPSSPYSGVISLFAASLAAGRAVTVHGDGLQTRDFVFVGDIVAFLQAGMRQIGVARAALVLNACTGRETSVRTLAETLGGLLQMRPTIVSGPVRPGDIRRSVGCPGQATALLGVAASTDLADGLETTLHHAARDMPTALAAMVRA
jgi:UDP-glucose 4-epimerase